MLIAKDSLYLKCMKLFVYETNEAVGFGGPTLLLV